VADVSEENKAIDKKTKEHALEVENKLKELAEDLGPKYWKMACLISEVHGKALWRILGHKTAQAYRESLMISKGAWFERRRLWDAWAGIAIERELITRAKLDRMRSQNVKQLLRLDEKRRFNPKWIEKALTLTEGALEAQVDHVLENNEEPETSLNQPESRAVLKVSMSTSQKAKVLEIMDRFADAESIDKDDQGKILELWAAEIESGLPNFVPEEDQREDDEESEDEEMRQPTAASA
jgi:hypothetical protein